MGSPAVHAEPSLLASVLDPPTDFGETATDSHPYLLVLTDSADTEQTPTELPHPWSAHSSVTVNSRIFHTPSKAL